MFRLSKMFLIVSFVYKSILKENKSTVESKIIFSKYFLVIKIDLFKVIIKEIILISTVQVIDTIRYVLIANKHTSNDVMKNTFKSNIAT